MVLTFSSSVTQIRLNDCARFCNTDEPWALACAIPRIQDDRTIVHSFIGRCAAFLGSYSADRYRYGIFIYLFSISTISGCAGQPKPLFENQDSIVVWPALPRQPRIRWIGEFRTSADLKPGRKPFQSLGELLVGSEEPDPLFSPRDVVCTRDGQRVWVVDPGGRCLHRFDLKSRDYLKMTRFGDEPVLSPVSVCLGPRGTILVCDSEQASMYLLSDQDGSLVRSLQLPPEMDRPVAAAYDSKSRQIYAVDARSHNVKVLGEDGTLIRIIGRRGTEPGSFNFPSDATVDSGILWVVDSGNHRVQALKLTGEPVRTIGQAGDAPGDFALPKAIAIDPDGHVYVVDARFENVQLFDSNGRLLLFFGNEGDGPGEFALPGGIFIEPNGRIWICDPYNHRLQVFQYIRSLARARSTNP